MAVERGVWLSVYIGLVCLFVSLLIALMFPETRSLSATENEDQTGGERSDGSISSNSPKGQGLWARISEILELKQMAILIKYFFWENKRLGLLLLSLIFTTLGNYVTVVLMQYTTKRFGWTWAKVR